MKAASILVFCTACLAGSLALAYVLYPYARLADEVLISSTTAKPIEDFDQLIDLGEDFGSLTVIELMGYYLENPPEAESQVNQDVPERHFGGC